MLNFVFIKLFNMFILKKRKNDLKTIRFLASFALCLDRLLQIPFVIWSKFEIEKFFFKNCLSYIIPNFDRIKGKKQTN